MLTRGRRAVAWRLVSARTRVRHERELAGWRRGKHVPLPAGVGSGRLAVVFCTWRRLERLEHTLRLLAAQDVPVQALIWNNSPRRETVDAAVAASPIPVRVHHSPRNIGGFGRFYLAREIAEAGHDRVVFIDDDHDFGPSTVSDLLSRHEPGTLSGWWAFRFLSADYGDRVRALPGELAKYVGTCGMIADTAVFRDYRLFRCPRRYWFVEDLWLCYFAEHIVGYQLFRCQAEFQRADDQQELYPTLGRRKWRLLRYLVRQGWELQAENYLAAPGDCRWTERPRRSSFLG
jgi:hypothetical protein